VSEPLVHPLSVSAHARGAVRIAAVIPARDEEERIAATIAAARSVDGIDLVVVVDDGSTDQTAAVARKAGAIVAAHPSARGKGAAMATGVKTLRHAGVDNYLLVFLDADLGESAVHADALIAPVVSGRAAMSIAVLPRATGDVGGHGFVLALARDGITYRLDLDALEAAFAAGARAYLLCSPHNPTGLVFTRDELEAVVRLARRYDVEMPIAQEVHNALFEGKSVQRCLIDLLARESKDELEGFRLWTEKVTGSPD